jgi:outer membrane protein assembly factor BamE
MKSVPVVLRPIAIVVATLLAFTVAGCANLANFGVHRIDIQQGNVVTKAMLETVKPGMTRTEVRNLLGAPLLTDPFHADRWDYYFSQSKGGRELERASVVLLFKDDKLTQVLGEGLATDPARRNAKS